MPTRYAVCLTDPLNQLVLYADTPFEAVRQAQITTGRLDQHPPGRHTFRVTAGVTLVPECQTWGDPCPSGCECEQVLHGADEILVPVVLDRDAGGTVIVSRDGAGPVATRHHTPVGGRDVRGPAHTT